MMLKLARERGCTAITGVDMFLRQAALQFKLYTGQDAPVDVMRRGPETQALAPSPRMTEHGLPLRRPPGQGLALVGYRGTGKSTVGRILAERLDRPFLDADLEIEARAGRSIAAIFADEGEPVFRDWEERTLAELIDEFPTAVLATGGGVVLREANRRRLRDFGFVVWLQGRAGALARRLAADRAGWPSPARFDDGRRDRRDRPGPR